MRRIEQEISAGRVRLYRNLVGQPYVYCDVDGEGSSPALPPIHQHLDDDDFRGWINLFAWERLGLLLSEREITRILDALRAWSLRTKTARITDPELLRVIEAEPVVAAVLEFMFAQKQPRYEQKMGRLWEELRKFASERGLVARGKSRFPGGPNVLSHKVRHWSRVLEKAGVRVTLARSNGCNVVLERLDDPQAEPPREPSTPKSQQPESLPLVSGADGLLSVLRAKYLSLTPPSGHGEPDHG